MHILPNISTRKGNQTIVMHILPNISTSKGHQTIVMHILPNISTSKGNHTIVMHILPNISTSKGNQTMKFGQIIKHDLRNIFLKKSCTKCGEETIPRPFSKNSKLSICLDQ